MMETNGALKIMKQAIINCIFVQKKTIIADKSVENELNHSKNIDMAPCFSHNISLSCTKSSY